MGVSTGGTDLDLAAVIAGGDSFVNRIAEMKAAKESYDKSLAQLNLGKSAVAANNEAQAILADAIAKRDADMAALDAELKTARDSLAKWSDQVKTETSALKQKAIEANELAQSLKSEAEQNKAQAKKELEDSDKKAARIIADANAQAAKIISDAEAAAVKLNAETTKLNSQLAKSIEAAKASEAKFKAKLQILNNATSAALTE